MTAGTAATARVDAAAPVHNVDQNLPFQPRRLSPSERSHRELCACYCWRSRSIDPPRASVRSVD